MTADHNGVSAVKTRPTGGFNENHRTQLRLTFQHIDTLLSDGSRILAGAEDGSPFCKYASNATPVQRKVANDYVARLRGAMVRIMHKQDIPFAAPVCGTLWAAQTNLTFVGVAIQELTPKRLRGYGPLSDEAGTELDRIRVELHDLLGRLTSYLARGESGDLQARLERLGDTSEEIALLRELEGIITVHGLVEVRGSLALLLDRLEGGDTFEIGVFGRVSAGKSSLLNYFLGSGFLSVGVTPVTALPTRIRYGAQPGATIVFAERREPLIIELARLSEFTSEQENPANAKHVARVEVRVPASRLLREGVTFVDTPGLGSLALAGAAETVAYLPRCDLGVVLVDAGAALTHEDLVIVQALYQAGAAAQVLVSKADLLTPADRTRTVDYLQSHLQSEVGVAPPVHLVSVAGADAVLCEKWLDAQLKPLLDGHKEQALAARKRKVGVLHEEVRRALQARVGKPPAAATALREEEVAAILREGAVLLESAHHEGYDLASAISALGSQVIETAAQTIAASWVADPADGEAADPSALLWAAMMEAVAVRTVRARQRLDTLKAQASEALELTTVTEEDSGEPLPLLGPLPIIQPPVFLQRLALHRSAWLAMLGKAVLHRQIAKQLEAKLGAELHEVLRRYGEQVRGWFLQSLDELRAAFSVRADLRCAAFAATARTSGASPQPDVETINRDLSVLQKWEAGKGTP